MCIYLGNEVTDQLTLSGAELFGFNTGNFDSRVVPAEEGKRHTAGIAWRFQSDLDLLAKEKKITPLCQCMQVLASENGLGDVSLPEHILAPKMHPAATRLISDRQLIVFLCFCMLLACVSVCYWPAEVFDRRSLRTFLP